MSEALTNELNPEDQNGQTMGATPPTQTHAYLLRLWRSSTDSTWRGSLQSVQSGERHMFADVESLFAFLDMVLR